MKLEKITKIKKLLQNIEFFLFAGLIFFVIGIGVVNKITSNRFYFFGNRFDVVLTDSMSSKNENHLDFLEGYDNQIQKFDFVVSEKITKKTKIDIHDIVLFNNPPIGTDMHRVIDIERYGDEVKICNLVKTEFENIETFRFRSAGSYISIDKITFKSFQLVSYSKEPLKDTYYYFYVNGKIVDANYSSSKINSYYKNVVTYSLANQSPVKFAINKQNYDENDYVESITFNNEKEEGIFPKDINGEVEISKTINIKEKYLIRGDKAKTDDGWFERDAIFSKVEFVIPKFGYVARFISSPWGTIMLVGLALIPFIYGAICNRKKSSDE